VPIRDNEMCYFTQSIGRDSGTGWTVPWSNPSRCEIFLTRPDRPRGPPSLLKDGCRVSFPGVKWPGHGDDHPPPSSVEVKGRAELCIYFPCGPSWTLLGWTLTLLSTIVVTVSQQHMKTWSVCPHPQPVLQTGGATWSHCGWPHSPRCLGFWPLS
jgi:hypothetical protein